MSHLQMTDKEIFKLVGLDEDRQLSIFKTTSKIGGIRHVINQPLTEEMIEDFQSKQHENPYASTLKEMCEISGLDFQKFSFDNTFQRIIYNDELFVTDSSTLMSIVQSYQSQEPFKLIFNKVYTYKESLNEEELKSFKIMDLSYEDIFPTDNDELQKTMFEFNRFLIGQWDNLEDANNHVKKLVDNGDLERALFIFGEVLSSIGIDKITRYLFKKADSLNGEELYNLWREAYQLNEKGYEHFHPLFEKTYNRQFPSVQKRIDALKPLCDKKGFIYIYRGESDESTPYKKALSWTLSKNVACSFAFRFKSTAYRLVTCKVHIDDIMDTFIHDSSLAKEELEIIVNPKKVKLISITEVQDTSELVEKLSKTVAPPMTTLNIAKSLRRFYFDVYKGALVLFDGLNNEHDLFECSALHGFDHTKRVLLHAIHHHMLFKDEFKLRGSDLEILIVSALLHDIGRVHDEEDYLHGQQSVEKAHRLGIDCLGLTGEDAEITKFIMANHNIPDLLAIKNLNKYDIRDKKRAKILYNLFCDSDGLDRVRLHDLDITYLRHDKTKLLLPFAEDVLKML